MLFSPGIIIDLSYISKNSELLPSFICTNLIDIIENKITLNGDLMLLK
jgi:hypothetical protein